MTKQDKAFQELRQALKSKDKTEGLRALDKLFPKNNADIETCHCGCECEYGPCTIENH